MDHLPSRVNPVSHSRIRTANGYRYHGPMHALTSTVTVLDRPDVATIRLGGNDVLRYLHAVCTQHTLDLVPGDATSALLLSPKGKIEAAFRLAVLEDGGL